jgi:hypothetical protein
MIESAAGSRVTESSTAAATTKRPPMAIERVSVIGVMRSPTNPSNTVSPLVTTARPAVTIVRSAASRELRPRLSSSLNRVTMSRE